MKTKLFPAVVEVALFATLAGTLWQDMRIIHHLREQRDIALENCASMIQSVDSLNASTKDAISKAQSQTKECLEVAEKWRFCYMTLLSNYSPGWHGATLYATNDWWNLSGITNWDNLIITNISR